MVGYYTCKLLAERETTTEKEQQSGGDMAQNDADEALANLQVEYSRLEIADSQSDETSAASSAGSNNANARLRELTPEKICAEAIKAADANYCSFAFSCNRLFEEVPQERGPQSPFCLRGFARQSRQAPWSVSDLLQRAGSLSNNSRSRSRYLFAVV